MSAMVSIRVGPSSEHAVSAAWANTLTTSEASAPKLTVSISAPASAAASRNSATPLSSRGNVWAVKATPSATSPAPHTTVASKLSAPMTWMSPSPAASSCSSSTPVPGMIIAV